MQNLKAERGGAGGGGDFLDYGYWGGDGTASVYWGMTVPGIDVTGVSPIGVMRAEFDYAMYNMSLSQAFGANSISIFGGIATPQAILRAKAVDSSSSGTPLGQSGTPIRAYATINGGPRIYTAADLIKALNSVDPASVTNLTFVGHGTEDSIQIGYTGVITFTSDGWGGYNFLTNNGLTLNSSLNYALASNATVNFYGCNTATGNGNLTQVFSSSYSSALASGYLGDGTLVAYYTYIVYYYGTTVTYRNGHPVKH